MRFEPGQMEELLRKINFVVEEKITKVFTEELNKRIENEVRKQLMEKFRALSRLE